jgi:ABC-type uncharacterized transport system permease subunit
MSGVLRVEQGRFSWRQVATPLVAILVGITTLVMFLMFTGHDAAAGLDALWRGSFGSPYAILSATLVRATPLLVLGLAFALGARAGALNIGMEGQFATGGRVNG